jgi:hypothetical protein
VSGQWARSKCGELLEVEAVHGWGEQRLLFSRRGGTGDLLWV